MITKQTILKYVCVIGLGFALNVGCSSDDSGGLPEVPELPEEGDFIEGDGISEDELETFMGEIGILLDARPYIRKGQPITKLRVTPTDSDYFEPMVLEVDPFTNYVSFKLDLENLSSEAETALRNGINLEIDLLDENDNELFKEILENTLFTENGSDVELRGDGVEDLNTEVHLNPDTPYFLQLVTDDGQIESKALDNALYTATGPLFPIFDPTCANAFAKYASYPSRSSETDFSSNNTTQQFYFQKHEDEDEENIYSIISRDTDTYLAIEVLGLLKEVYTSEVRRTNDYKTLGDAYKFQIRKENGTYQLAIYKEPNPLSFITKTRSCDFSQEVSSTTLSTPTIGSSTGQNFRFATTDVEYEAQSIETWYGQPILPAAENSFKVNSTLTNCTSAVISQDVGVDLTETKTMSVSWQETVGFTAGATLTTEVTVGAKAGVSFFGNGGEVSGEVSVALELSVEMSKSATNAEERTTETGSTIFTKRVVPVNPGKQVLVYDAVQTYPAIRVPFVQRIKITGRNSDQVALTGEELATQSAFGGFTGTITEIGTNSIEITVRGMTTFDNTAEIQLEASETDADCN
ncbi:hypothetical protein N9954_03855 [Maribacter sp.]|nr:hypothetical protein [Maribacter sp.]